MKNAIRVIICHKDIDYLNKLVKYLTMKYMGEMILTGVSDIDKLCQLYNTGYKADAIIFDGALKNSLEPIIKNYNIQNFYYLLDNVHGLNGRYISKYLPPRDIGEYILENISPISENESGYRAQTLGVMSISGGSGGSMLSQRIARALGSEEKPAFLMSFNYIYPYADVVDVNKDTFDIPYMSLKLHSEEFEQGLKSVLVKEAGVRYLPPLAELGDEMNLGREEFQKLVDGLSEKKSHSGVVDFGAKWTKNMPDYLDALDKGILIIKNDSQEKRKIHTFFNKLQADRYFSFDEFMKKMIVVCNRFSVSEFRQEYQNMQFRDVLEMGDLYPENEDGGLVDALLKL